MKEHDEKPLRDFLKQALPPIGETAPRRDLWPELLRRLEGPRAAVPWFDWVLAAVTLIWLLLFPEAIPVLAYHL